MRLIDADALYDKAEENYKTASGFYRPIYKGFVDDIADAPTVDATPVVHGRWNIPFISGTKRTNPFCYCTNCCYPVAPKRESKYCPNCGAKMDSPEKDGSHEP